MSKLLYIEASPRKERSSSIAVARAFIDAFCDADAVNEVETLDIWDFPLPEIDGDLLNARYRILHGDTPTEAEARAWEEIVRIVERFKAADRYLWSLPMWNFSIPYKLKHFVDTITHPGLTFTFAPETGYQGLMTGKPVTVIYARGGEYGSAEARAMDLQKAYMELFLGFIGFEDIQTVLVAPTLADRDSMARTLAAAKEQAVAFAGDFPAASGT